LDVKPLAHENMFDVFFRINQLNYNHEIYFVTNRPTIEAKQQTENWFINNGICNPTVVITKKKGDFAKAVGVDFSIEDKPENAWCVAWLSPNTKSYLINRSYNQVEGNIGSSKVIRIDSVGEYLDAIESEVN
jgi:uncharacterized HAD superfamily protein